MKRTNSKAKNALNLGRRLALVRDTIRELNPHQLEQANGGSEEEAATPTTCHLNFTIVK
jgi:hypothetical protein